MTMAMDVDDAGDWYVTSNEAITDPLPLSSPATLSTWLERRLTADDIRPDELQVWIDTALTHLLEQRGLAFDSIDHDRWQLAHILRERLQMVREQAQRQLSDQLLTPALVRASKPEQHFRFSAYTTTGETATGFEKHAYPTMAAFDSMEEQRAAQALDTHPRVQRWIRNPVGTHGFALPRRPLAGRCWFYPDFSADLVDGPLLMVEVKGSHLVDTIDAHDKIAAARLWAEITGTGFVLVVGVDLAAISLALALDRNADGLNK
jgi:type III restriction enzyme